MDYKSKLASISVLGLALAGCSPAPKTISYRQPASYDLQTRVIDDLIRNQDSWTVQYTDNNKEVHEEQIGRYQDHGQCASYGFVPQVSQLGLRGLDGSGKTLRVFKDLPAGEAPVQKTLKYGFKIARGEWNCSYVEFHLPEDYRISPGTGQTSDKVPIRYHKRSMR